MQQPRASLLSCLVERPPSVASVGSPAVGSTGQLLKHVSVVLNKLFTTRPAPLGSIILRFFRHMGRRCCSGLWRQLHAFSVVGNGTRTSHGAGDGMLRSEMKHVNIDEVKARPPQQFLAFSDTTWREWKAFASAVETSTSRLSVCLLKPTLTFNVVSRPRPLLCGRP